MSNSFIRAKREQVSVKLQTRLSSSFLQTVTLNRERERHHTFREREREREPTLLGRERERERTFYCSRGKF